MGTALAKRLTSVPAEKGPPGISIMSNVNIKQYYSTKRKRDVVTFMAIVFFGALIIFQLYITIIFPIQLRHQQLLIAEMEKDEMYEQIDRIREAVRRTRGKDSIQIGEINLLTGVMDQFALHVREHGKEMTPEQVNGLRTELRRYELVILGWNYGNRRTLFPEETTRDVNSSLEEFFGDMDSGRQIDFDKDTSFSKYIKSNREIKYHIIPNELDTSPNAKKIENEIVNSH